MNANKNLERYKQIWKEICIELVNIKIKHDANIGLNKKVLLEDSLRYGKAMSLIADGCTYKEENSDEELTEGWSEVNTRAKELCKLPVSELAIKLAQYQLIDEEESKNHKASGGELPYDFYREFFNDSQRERLITGQNRQVKKNKFLPHIATKEKAIKILHEMANNLPDMKLDFKKYCIKMQLGEAMPIPKSTLRGYFLSITKQTSTK